MKDILFNKYLINLKSLQDGFISDFAGSMIRGALFASLRELVCLTKSEICKDCIVWEQCVYSFFFETPIIKSSNYIKIKETPPHPFIIEPSYPHRHFIEKDKALSFSIILIGKGIVYLPHIICAIIRMIEKGMGKKKLKFSLENIELQQGDNKNIVIYDNEKLMEHPIIYKSYSFFDKSYEANEVTLNFLTPLRIKHQGHLCKDLSFEILMKNILRRLTFLSLFYGEGNDKKNELENENINSLLEKAKQINKVSDSTSWVDLSRFSFRQKQSMQLGGIKGKVIFEGSLSEFIPYLKLCELLHVGKNTSFGLGKYVLL